EVLSLRWSVNIDFENRLIVWPGSVTKNGEPKVFPFTDRLEKILREQRAIVTAWEKKLGHIIPFVFPRYCCPNQYQGRAMVYFDKRKQKECAAKYFYDQWDKALEAAKLPRKIPHDLRRTAAIRRDAAGISENSNMKLGGWKTPAMLHRYLEAKDVENLRAE